MTFYLILIFSFNTGYSGGLSAAALPVPFPTHEACVAAAESAKADYTGRDYINWTCVPTGSEAGQ